MKAFGFFAMAIGVLMLAPVNAGEDATKKDLQRLQGNWWITYREVSAEVESVGNWLVIKGDKYTLESADGEITGRGTHELDATKNPKWIDVKTSEGKVLRGIYEILDDVYIACYSQDTSVRPTRFTSNNGGAINLFRRR